MKPEDMLTNGVPKQTQRPQPGIETKMDPQPHQPIDYKGSGKLKDKVALITGGDSGIGRAVAIMYAKEGADVAISYLNEDDDADNTKAMIEKEGRKCLLLPGDIKDPKHCEYLVDKTVETFGKLNILVNNAAIQFVKKKFEDISNEQLEEVFQNNIFSQFYLTKAAVPHMSKGDSIISTSSITAFRGSSDLIDYASTKGAITSFVRSLAQNLADRGIRVNAVAPGPVWTPLIPASFEEDDVESFGQNTLMGRPGQPSEHAAPYVLLASEDGSFITGQTIHVNGGSYLSS
ncbi:hypothetical protein GGQ92_001245 [Gracilibacillus halotolerans]|uniref:NAD(P)-dependent dehydrogenase, short-chain alcohol dehydrogenase family n=1 Tax=Gracilibacillus halotolerans TaxID=74386 RepID=A0A841RKH8_9BACI|nr:SDR family oxidoreductase [Gracilibacillus halotolerans]MBB6512462.1 hypothetical protein [Gracilibacillus halotolerans]